MYKQLNAQRALKIAKPFKPLKRKIPDVSLINEVIKNKKLPSKDSNSHYIWYGYKADYYDDLAKEPGIHNLTNDVCYARLTGVVLKARVFVNQHLRFTTEKNKDYYPVLMDWFDYVTKRSHFKDAFFKASRKEWLRDGLGLNCSRSSSYVMAAITALREGWEFVDKTWAWDWFKKKGFTEDEAFVLSYYFIHTKKKGFEYSLHGGGHASFNGARVSLKGIKEFLSGEFLKRDTGPAMNKKWQKWQVHDLTAPNSDNTFNKELFKKKGKVINAGGWDESVQIEVTDQLLNEIKEQFRGK